MEIDTVKKPKYPIITDLSVPDEIFNNWQEILNLLAEIAHVPAALIMRVHAQEIEVFGKSQNKENIYPQGEKADLDSGLYCETVMDTQKQLIVPYALEDVNWENNPDVELGMISYFGLPLIWPNGEIFGTICLLDVKKNNYSLKYQKLIKRFRENIQSDLITIFNNSRQAKKHKQLKSELHFSEEKYQTLIETIPAVSYTASFDGKSNKKYVSPQIKSMLGFSPEHDQSATDCWIKQLHPDDSERVLNEVQETCRTKKNFHSEYRMLTKTGETIWVTDEAKLITAAKGNEIQLQGLITDTTEKKIYEDKLQKQNIYIQKVIDGVSDGIMVVKPDFTVELMNKAIKNAYEKITCADPQQPKCYEITHHLSTPCTNETHQCPVKQVLETGKNSSVAHRHLIDDGIEQFVDIKAAPLKDTTGNITAVILAIHDITPLLDIQNKLHEHAVALNYQANHDELTNLPNRVLFIDRLNQAIKVANRSHNKIAILFIDLDRFKEINDSMGHSIGDKVLIEISSRLTSCIRESDTIARLGGDEFIVILDNINNTDVATKIAETIIDKIKSCVPIDEHKFYVTASIGISIFPNDGNNTELLIKNADAAMYKAKDDGRNTYRYYTEEMTQKAFEHVLLESNFRSALENDELTVYYQPQVNIVDGRIVGIEALVRWIHPQLGLISPDKFIPLAEITGLIIRLGEIVLAQASKHVSQWKNKTHFEGRLAINLSIKQLEQNNFVSNVHKILKENKCQPDWIEFEVTEGYLMTNPELATQTLHEIRKMGITVSIDDFGTGYSSLSYLKKLPINKLKIDRSFVLDLASNEEDKAIVVSVISLAKAMKLNVIAEGVETIEQKNFLQSQGCNIVQGYLYSKPVCQSDMSKMLNSVSLKI